MATVVNRDKNQLSTFLNGRMVGTSSLDANELPELRLSDWFVGGPGAFNSSQYFAGQMDDLRIYDKALSAEEISKIFNSGEGDIGIVGVVNIPAVTNEETVTFQLSFTKFDKPVDVSGISENDINASLSNGEIVPNSLVTSGDGVFQFEATFTSYQQMEFDLPKGADNSEGEDTLRVMRKISRVPEVPKIDSIVHWWWMDEGLGTTVTDSIGESHGTLKVEHHGQLIPF